MSETSITVFFRGMEYYRSLNMSLSVQDALGLQELFEEAGRPFNRGTWGTLGFATDHPDVVERKLEGMFGNKTAFSIRAKRDANGQAITFDIEHHPQVVEHPECLLLTVF